MQYAQSYINEGKIVGQIMMDEAIPFLDFFFSEED